MTNDLISRSELLAKSIRVTETDEGGWERVLRAVPVEEIEKAEAVKIEGDLISRDALLRRVRSYAESKVCSEGLETANNILRTVQVIEAAPAVEAEPIKYGEFAILGEQFFPSITATIKRCKTCNVEFILLFRNPLEGYYCPRCGARKKEADNAQE